MAKTGHFQLRSRLKTLSTSFSILRRKKYRPYWCALTIGCPLLVLAPGVSPGLLVSWLPRCGTESEDSAQLIQWICNSNSLCLFHPFAYSLMFDVLHTVINSVYVQLANRASHLSCNRCFSWGYDPYTHACKARPLTSVGRTSFECHHHHHHRCRSGSTPHCSHWPRCLFPNCVWQCLRRPDRRPMKSFHNQEPQHAPWLAASCKARHSDERFRGSAKTAALKGKFAREIQFGLKLLSVSHILEHEDQAWTLLPDGRCRYVHDRCSWKSLCEVLAFCNAERSAAHAQPQRRDQSPSSQSHLRSTTPSPRPPGYGGSQSLSPSCERPQHTHMSRLDYVGAECSVDLVSLVASRSIASGEHKSRPSPWSCSHRKPRPSDRQLRAKSIHARTMDCSQSALGSSGREACRHPCLRSQRWCPGHLSRTIPSREVHLHGLTAFVWCLISLVKNPSCTQRPLSRADRRLARWCIWRGTCSRRLCRAFQFHSPSTWSRFLWRVLSYGVHRSGVSRGPLQRPLKLATDLHHISQRPSHSLWHAILPPQAGERTTSSGAVKLGHWVTNRGTSVHQWGTVQSLKTVTRWIFPVHEMVIHVRQNRDKDVQVMVPHQPTKSRGQRTGRAVHELTCLFSDRESDWMGLECTWSRRRAKSQRSGKGRGRISALPRLAQSPARRAASPAPRPRMLPTLPMSSRTHSLLHHLLVLHCARRDLVCSTSPRCLCLCPQQMRRIPSAVSPQRNINSQTIASLPFFKRFPCGHRPRSAAFPQDPSSRGLTQVTPPDASTTSLSPWITPAETPCQKSTRRLRWQTLHSPCPHGLVQERPVKDWISDPTWFSQQRRKICKRALSFPCQIWRWRLPPTLTFHFFQFKADGLRTALFEDRQHSVPARILSRLAPFPTEPQHTPSYASSADWLQDLFPCLNTVTGSSAMFQQDIAAEWVARLSFSSLRPPRGRDYRQALCPRSTPLPLTNQSPDRRHLCQLKPRKVHGEDFFSPELSAVCHHHHDQGRHVLLPTNTVSRRPLHRVPEHQVWRSFVRKTYQSVLRKAIVSFV